MLHMNKKPIYQDCYDMLNNITIMKTERSVTFAHGQLSGAASYFEIDMKEWSNLTELARKLANQKYREIENGE